MPKKLSLSALALACTLGLSGCFAADSKEASGSNENGGRISVAHMQPPRSGLTPLSDDAFKLSRWSTAETLISLDAEGTPQALLATEWEQVDDLNWHFTIREGVKFHNGEPLNAQAVVNSLQQAIEASPKPRILNGTELKITAEGEYGIHISTAEPDPLLPNRLSSPQLAIMAPAAYKDKTIDPVGTGTGPFVLKSVDGVTGASLDRNEDYWGQKAQADGIDVKFVPDGTARAAALRTGEADIVEAIPVGQAASVDAERLTEVPMPRTNTLYLNTESGPFADPAVRAAAREAIDRAQIIASTYENRADEAAGLLGPALPYAAEQRTSEDYKAILAHRAEPAKVDGVKISLGTFTDRAELPEVAVLIEQQLEAAGFVVEQDVREYQYIEADALEGKFDAFILSRATVLDSGDPVAYFAADFSCEGGFSISQLCSPQVDAAIKKANETAPGEERQKAIGLAEAEILATDAAIPLLHERVLQGESERVQGAARDPRERLLVTAETSIK